MGNAASEENFYQSVQKTIKDEDDEVQDPALSDPKQLKREKIQYANNQYIAMQNSFKNKVFTVNKYGRKNMVSADTRYLYFDQHLTKMYWKDSIDSKIPSKVFKTDKFVSIVTGRDSENFTRFKTKNQDKVELSVIIQTEGRTIDLEFYKFEEKAMFYQAVKIMIESQQKCVFQNGKIVDFKE